MKALHSQKEMLVTQNRSLAEYNLSQEPIMRQTRANLESKKNLATVLLQQVKELQAKVNGQAGKTDPGLLHALLEVG